MKSLLFTLFSLGLFQATIVAQSSFGLRLVHNRPVGELGFVMKPLTTAELIYYPSLDEDSRFKAFLTASLLNYKPRLAEFPVYAEEPDLQTGETTIVPGIQIFNKYQLWQMSIGSDFAYIKLDNFNAFVGVECLFGFSVANFETNYSGRTGSGFDDNDIFIGYRAKLGCEYMLNDTIGISLTVSRLGYRLWGPASRIGAVDIGIGARYILDN